jgi:hypothetical protein
MHKSNKQLEEFKKLNLYIDGEGICIEYKGFDLIFMLTLNLGLIFHGFSKKKKNAILKMNRPNSIG